MPPRNFYEIKGDAFLFGKTKTPEECVRQWIIFELISTYGYLINQIKIEVPVKYGTKTGYADIVVYKENMPFIVIECKKQQDEKFEQHLAQAKSYAAGLGIKAEYSVYSNGDYWIVQRLINGQWEYCLDIPSASEIIRKADIVELFNLYDSIRFMLSWRYKKITQENFDDFWMAITSFFGGSCYSPILIKGVNEKLLSGVFNLLIAFLRYDDGVDKYFKQLYQSYKYFIEYYLQDNIKNIINFIPSFKYKELFCVDDIKDMTEVLLNIFNQQVFINSKRDFYNLDTAIIRFIIAILHHIEHQIKEPNEIFDIDDNISIEFFNYFELALKINLNIELPDRLHKEKIKQLEKLCEKYCSQL